MTAGIGRWFEWACTRIVYGRRPVIVASPSMRRAARRDPRLRGEIFVLPPACEAVGTESLGERRRSEHERILCVGRLVPQNRIDLIIGAVAELLPDFARLELHLVGDGAERDALVAAAQRLGLGDHVVFHGALYRRPAMPRSAPPGPA